MPEEKPEPPRMRLADPFAADGLGPLVDNPPELPRKVLKPIERQKCALCGGEVMRSRVRFYERPWVMWSRTRPYRCLECGVRLWRKDSKS